MSLSCCNNLLRLFLPPSGAGVTARLSLCEAGGAEDSKEREPEEEEGH